MLPPACTEGIWPFHLAIQRSVTASCCHLIMFSLMDAARKSSRYGHRDATMILLAYRHGFRASELCDLQWSQVELNAGRLHVRRVKQGTPATHPIVGDELRADADTATALIARAIEDPAYRAAERVELARIEGVFKYLTRSLEGFLATGEQTMAALIDGRRRPPHPR